MGCDIHIFLERRLWGPDAESASKRIMCLLIKQRSLNGSEEGATLLPPEIFDMIARFVPTIYVTNSWVECPYLEWAEMDRPTWQNSYVCYKNLHAKALARLLDEESVSPETIRQEEKLDAGECVCGPFWDERARYRADIELAPESFCPSTGRGLWHDDFEGGYPGPTCVIKGDRDYNAFRLFSSDAGRIRSGRIRDIEQLKCVQKGWPEDVSDVSRNYFDEDYFHSFGTCYLQDLFNVDWEVSCSSSFRSGAPIKVNAIVEICGLLARTELNGSTGLVCAFDETKGRYVVLIKEKNFALKAENMHVLEVETPLTTEEVSGGKTRLEVIGAPTVQGLQRLKERLPEGVASDLRIMISFDN